MVKSNMEMRVIKLSFDLSASEVEIAKQRDERDEAIRSILKPILWTLQSGGCPHCDRTIEPIFSVPPGTTKPPRNYPTLEHVVPRSYGGKTLADNILLAHAKCNIRKGSAEPSPREIEMIAIVTDYLRNRPAIWPLLPYLIPVSWVRDQSENHHLTNEAV